MRRLYPLFNQLRRHKYAYSAIGLIGVSACKKNIYDPNTMQILGTEFYNDKCDKVANRTVFYEYYGENGKNKLSYKFSYNGDKAVYESWHRESQRRCAKCELDKGKIVRVDYMYDESGRDMILCKSNVDQRVWKMGKTDAGTYVWIELLIPANTNVVTSPYNELWVSRVESAKVLQIADIYNKKYHKAKSAMFGDDQKLDYVEGMVLKCTNFDDDLSKDFADGIQVHKYQNDCGKWRCPNDCVSWSDAKRECERREQYMKNRKAAFIISDFIRI